MQMDFPSGECVGYVLESSATVSAVLSSPVMAKSCPKCGAPHEWGLILCKFCRTPFDEEEARRAVPCLQCKELFPEKTARCPRCNDWLVVQCVFCMEVTPLNRTHCDHCGEVFAGAPERKRHRDSSAQNTAKNTGVGWPNPSATPTSSRGWPAPVPSQGGGDAFDAWTRPPPGKDVSELFSSFGNDTNNAEPPPQNPSSGWDMNSWANPKKK